MDKSRGLLIIQLDGVAARTLERAIAEGLMPAVADRLARGGDRLVAWDSGLPSQTSSSQAGILYGHNDDIPGFRWYEKENRRLLVSNHPGDAAELERRLARKSGLLANEGASVANLLTGQAAHPALTMSAIGLGVDRVDNVLPWMLNPGGIAQTVVATVREVIVEIWQGWRQTLLNVRPRVARRGSFPLLRAASNVILRDLTLAILRRDLRAGVPIAYATFVGYDVIAHHAGPERPESMAVLRDFDRVVREIVREAEYSPRAYELVLLSDHGQTQGATFRQRSGHTIESVVKRLARARSVTAPVRRAEGWGHLSALLSEAIKGDKRRARVARRVLRRRRRGPYVEVGPERYRKRREDAEVVVCASGSLANIYLADWPGRLSLEGINAAYPGLIEGLLDHDGISFVLVGSEHLGPVVLGHAGVHRLDDGHVQGADPLAPFGERASEHLLRLHSFPHVGDLVLNGRFDPATGEVSAFEELVGSHGGLGGEQNRPFLIYPAGWGEGLEDADAATIHDLLRSRRDRIEAVPG